MFNSRNLAVCLVVAATLSRETVATTCNIFTGPEFVEEVVEYASFAATDIAGDTQTITAKVPTTVVGDVMRLVSVDEEDGTGDEAGSFWLTEKLRLADGFVVEFDFAVNGSSDGFAFVAQNDKIENIEGNTGASLGVKNGLENFLAIGFDFCLDRSICAGDFSVSVFRDPADTIKTVLLDNTLVQKNGETHNVKIFYAANIDLLRVELDSVLALNTSLAPSTPKTIWGEDRFAFIGFTGSNAGLAPANIDIQSFTLSKFISEAKLRAGTSAKEVQIGSSVSLIIDIVDSCNEPSAAVVATNNISLNSFETHLVFEPDGQAGLIPPVSLTQQDDATFIVVFQIEFIGEYGFQAAVNGVQVQGTPTDLLYVGIDTFTLPGYAIGLLIALLVIILLASAYAIRRLLRYRQKLLENEENIAYGYERDHLDKLENDVIYEPNPLLLGSIDEMRAKLQENEAELERMRLGKDELVNDPEFTLKQLNQENAALLEELNRLKKDAEQRSVFTNVRRSVRLFPGKSNKKEFNQQRTSVKIDALSSKIKKLQENKEEKRDDDDDDEDVSNLI